MEPVTGNSEVSGEPVPILAPEPGTLIRRYDPDVADLPHRPSVVIALFEPPSPPR
jgi:hypothetical protein